MTNRRPVYGVLRKAGQYSPTEVLLSIKKLREPARFLALLIFPFRHDWRGRASGNLTLVNLGYDCFIERELAGMDIWHPDVELCHERMFPGRTEQIADRIVGASLFVLVVNSVASALLSLRAWHEEGFSLPGLIVAGNSG